MVMSFGGCNEKQLVKVDIPEGLAADTLMIFAEQTSVEILFDLDSVQGVNTNLVQGVYYSGEALELMLIDTPLRVDYEVETGAYAVFLEVE